MFDTAASRPEKWTATDYDKRRLMDWRPPKQLVYPCGETEKSTLEHLKNTFSPLPPYKQLEEKSRADDTLVTVDTRIPDGYIAFLENTAEQCTSPQTKHSQEGMQGAHHWVQRVDTAENLFRRLTDGYGISLMFGERHHQFIRNSNNWRGIAGVMLDLDVWRDAEHPKAPEPVYSLDELLQRYPLLAEICSFILPSASSLHEGRPFKARGIVLFDEPITDQRVYRVFGDILCSELDCIPPNVTKNPVAVGFGNTHNAPQAWRNNAPDTDWIQNATKKAKQKVREENTEREAKRRVAEARQQVYRERQSNGVHNGKIGTGENISAFIERCDPVAEMVRDGLLIPEPRNRYKWHQSNSPSSCEIIDGVIKIFSETMASASPTGSTEPINAHRFYLFQLTGLDLANESEQTKCREYLFECGYGDDPKAFAEKQQQQSRRYQANTEHTHDTSNIETERHENQNLLEKWLQETEQKKGKHALVLGSAAGTGKTTISVTTIERFLYIAKTTEEADNAYQLLFDAGEDVYRHRPRLFNRGHKDINGNNDWETLPLGLGEHERPCIQPELCNLHAERVGTPDAICAQCPFYTACKPYGYLSQAEKEKNTSKVVCAENERLACDEIFAERVKRICGKDDILITDEVNPLALTQARLFDRDTLYDLTERFRHLHKETKDDYQILKQLLDLTATAETPETFIDGLKDWIDSIKDIKALDEKIERYPVGIVFHTPTETAEHKQPFEATLIYQNQEVTVPVVDFEIGDDTLAYLVEPDTPIATDTYHVRFMPYSFLLKVGLATLDEPPIRHHKMLADLKTFFDENANIENAPFTFNAKHQSFEYHLKPTLNHRRVIFNTASDPDNLIGEAYRDTEINITRHTGTPPAWKTDLVFQVASGNYLPRQSLLECGDNKKLHLKPRAQELIDDFILPSIKARIKVLVVAPKAFQNVEGVKKWAATKIKDFQLGRNALLINHHHAEGRNDYQDFDIVFIFHYEPNHHEIHAAAKRIYRNPEIPLDFTREKRIVTVGGVSFEKNTYTDERVQAVYNRECRGRLMQSAMRLRPNIHEEKTIVFLTSEPIDIPITPIPFRPQDAKHFTGHWADFKDKLKANANAAIQDRIAAGESKSKAYRDTEEPRKQERKDRDAEIRQRFADGQSKKRIADEMSIGQATVKRVLDENTQRTSSHRNSQNVISNSYNKMGKTVTPTNTDVTGIDSQTATQPALQAPILLTEYSKLSIEDARAELQHCEETHNYNGVAYLRGIFKQHGWKVEHQEQDAPADDESEHESAVISELNDDNFDRLAISEKLAIDIETVRVLLEQLPVSDPRLKDFRKHIKRPSFEPPSMEPPLLEPPSWIQPILSPPPDWRPPEPYPEIPTEQEIENMYRDGHSHKEIADALDLPVEYVRTVLEEQHF